MITFPVQECLFVSQIIPSMSILKPNTQLIHPHFFPEPVLTRMADEDHKTCRHSYIL